MPTGNLRRIRQPLTRRALSVERKLLAREIAKARAVPFRTVWSELGFLVNRAPWPEVRAAVKASLSDADPIAGALERLGEGQP